MRNIVLWTVVSLYGVGLIFDGSVRNDYYTAFSYLFPTNTKLSQDLADTTRLVFGLLMTLSIFNIFSGLLFKIFSLISLVVYSVVINQQFILSPSISKKQHLCSILTHITLIFLCMDSIISAIIKQETRLQKQKTKQFIQKTKQQIPNKQNPKKSEESKKMKKEVDATSSNKNKNQEEAKNQKKESDKKQKPKAA